MVRALRFASTLLTAAHWSSSQLVTISSVPAKAWALTVVLDGDTLDICTPVVGWLMICPAAY